MTQDKNVSGNALFINVQGNIWKLMNSTLHRAEARAALAELPVKACIEALTCKPPLPGVDSAELVGALRACPPGGGGADEGVARAMEILGRLPTEAGPICQMVRVALGQKKNPHPGKVESEPLTRVAKIACEWLGRDSEEAKKFLAWLMDATDKPVKERLASHAGGSLVHARSEAPSKVPRPVQPGEVEHVDVPDQWEPRRAPPRRAAPQTTPPVAMKRRPKVRRPRALRIMEHDEPQMSFRVPAYLWHEMGERADSSRRHRKRVTKGELVAEGIRKLEARIKAGALAPFCRTNRGRKGKSESLHLRVPKEAVRIFRSLARDPKVRELGHGKRSLFILACRLALKMERVDPRAPRVPKVAVPETREPPSPKPSTPPSEGD